MENYNSLAHGFLLLNQSSHVPKGRFFLPAGEISFIFRNAPLLAFAVGPDLRGLVWVSHAFINSPSDFIRLYKLRLRLCMRHGIRKKHVLLIGLRRRTLRSPGSGRR